MQKRKRVILGFLTFCLIAALLVGVTSSADYDPWVDGNDDGIIDIVDIVNLAIRFGEEGTPINKTALLLELQDKIDSLNGTLEARIPQKGYISVGAAAFVPRSSDYSILNTGMAIQNYDTIEVWLLAGIQLPHGANVTKVIFYYYDGGGEYLRCRLWSNNQTDHTMMSLVNSLGNTGIGSTVDTSIVDPTVDNTKYHYNLEVSIPYSASHIDYEFNYVIIEYVYAA